MIGTPRGRDLSTFLRAIAVERAREALHAWALSGGAGGYAARACSLWGRNVWVGIATVWDCMLSTALPEISWLACVPERRRQ